MGSRKFLKGVPCDETAGDLTSIHRALRAIVTRRATSRNRLGCEQWEGAISELLKRQMLAGWTAGDAKSRLTTQNVAYLDHEKWWSVNAASVRQSPLYGVRVLCRGGPSVAAPDRAEKGGGHGSAAPTDYDTTFSGLNLTATQATS